MRVGVYIDGYNLYYGGRAVVGRSQPGWRWLDLRALSRRLVAGRRAWVARGATVDRVVYCTAFIDGSTNPNGRRDQDLYVSALRQENAIDLLEEGKYVSRVKRALLATEGAKGQPIISTSRWPVTVRDSAGTKVPEATFTVSYLHHEEKGSDVNVASHLLVDTLSGTIDAAVVISNDSDLRYPIQEARRRIPIGTVNPGQARLAGDLQGDASVGVGGHWWYTLKPEDFTGCQLPNPAGTAGKPVDW